MLAPALIFILGALVATLGALLMVPLVWRKAQSLAWREAEASLPMSLPEIRAEADKVRAEAAMRIRQQEILAETAREEARVARAQAGRLQARLVEAAAPLPLSLDQAVRPDPAATLDALRASPPANADEIEALNRRLETLDEDSGEQRLLLAAALLRIEQLEAELVAARRQARPAPRPARDMTSILQDGRFRAEIEALGAMPDDPANRAAIREKLDDIAVAVTVLAAKDSPPGSELDRLLTAAAASKEDVTGRLGGLILRQARQNVPS